jgi:DNA helicase-2/ATP-dependent DNA helicase PcrA
MSDPFDLDDDIPFDAPPGAMAAPGVPAAPLPTPWLDGLNPEQRQAVETTEGPVLVLSGAGTGKTRVLTTRLAHILLTQKARPWECLAVTFTNKAAREMRERISTMIGPVAENVWLGTFHSLGVRLLRRHAELVGLNSNFTILDTDDQERLLKQLMEAERLDTKKWTPRALSGTIQRWKDRGLTPAKVDGGEAGEFAAGRTAQLYAQYQDRLRMLNACDFGDLLLHCLTLFQDPANADLLAEYQRRFRYILVDEYQDTNVSQYLWLRLLAQKHKNICCVGDDDQSIYSWRGAEVGNILRFEKDFPGAAIVRLESNYRSTPQILAAASGLIAHNEGRLGKTLRPGGNAPDGDKVQVRGVWDGDEEARIVVDEIEALQRAGTSLAQMAVLVRAGFQTRAFEERLITCGVPYRVIGGPRFYERQEIRDAIAYFRVIAQPADDLAFERIINVPKRGLGDATLQAMHVLARRQSVPLTEAARQLCETDELKPKPRGTVAALLADFHRWRSLLDAMPAAELAATILDDSGYVAMWKADKAPEAEGRVENLKELVGSLEEFDSLGGFLEHVALVMDNEENTTTERVSLMTLHGAKGLEFDCVFLPGWEEGVFPHQKALGDNGAAGLEEERRLAYVGITRARKRVMISFAANRRIYNQWQSSVPSRFLDELPKAQVEMQSHQGLFGSRESSASTWGGGNSWSEAPNRRWANAPVIEASARAVENRASSGGFQPGDRVFHEKFGYGKVLAADGNKLEITFDKAGTKKVIDSFVSKG